MDYTTVIESKVSKVEGSLEELHNEISIATKYLHKLEANSVEVVRNLNCITTPSAYLEEFLNVNSFLLKSITFLTEFNCKFELLGITEKALSNGIFINKSEPPVAKPKITDEEHLYCNSAEDLVSVESCKGSDGNIIEVQAQEIVPDSHKPNSSSSKNENSTEKLKVLPCKNNKNNNISNKNKNKNKHAAKVTGNKVKGSSNVNKSNCANVSAKNKDNSLHTVQTKEKSNLNVINNSEDKALAEKVNAQENGEKNSVSGTDFQSGSVDINIEKISEVSNENCCISATEDLTNKASLTHTVGSTTQSSAGIPVAEVVPTKIIEKKSEDSEDFKDLEDVIKLNDNELDEIKPADIVRHLGKEYDVVVEFIKSPSEFYVSITDKETNLLEELENKLKEIPASKNTSCNTRNELTKTMLSREIGGHCLVYSKCDEMWFRAKVTNWCLNFNDEFVNVFLLDYGESKCVSIYDLQAMPKYLKQYPAFTVRCHLHDVFPIDMQKNSKALSWGKESSEEMKSLIEDSHNIRMRVETSDSFHPEISLPVTLWLVDEGNKCVNELLVNSKFAVHGKSVFEETEKKTEIVDTSADKIADDFRKENTALNDWNPMKEDYESYKNSYDLDANDPASIIYGYVGKDYDRICRHFAKNGHCFKGLACRKEHKKLDHLGFTTDQEEVFQSAISSLSVPPPKSIVHIQVTCLLACNKFFCFMERRKSSADEEDLPSLLQYMNRKENVLEMKKLLIPPSAGQIVIARYSQDEAWYRARVLESQPESDQCTVLFVDYGNSETLSLSDIRAIEARYLHLPFQAMQCCIFGIEQNPEVPVGKVMDYMQNIIDDGHLSIEVISRLPGDNINLLVNVFDQKGLNIGQDLISKKYAIFKEEMIINSASESIPG